MPLRKDSATTLFRGRKHLVALSPAFVGLALLMQSMEGGQRPINGAEAHQVIVGGACTVGTALSGNTDCLGMCANNPTYVAVGANCTQQIQPSCGTCGGTHQGSKSCRYCGPQ